MIVKGKSIYPGIEKGNLIISEVPISFLGDIDPDTGTIIAKDHPLRGTSIKDKVFAFPCGKGSTVGSYVIYQLRKNSTAPKAIINEKVEAIVAVGAIISEIPMVSDINLKKLRGVSRVEVDASSGKVLF